jgi:cation diffusion facilitator CzcD-associated flavoprotein CzcO
MNTQESELEMLDALIIDAGFSGLYQLYCLREKLGLSVNPGVA